MTSYRSKSEARKAVIDQAFLRFVKSATLEQLQQALANMSNKTAPRWKQVVIRRALSKFIPMSLDEILGLHELNVRDMKEIEIKEWQTTVERFRR